MDNELFTSICNGDIQNSIMLTTKIIFLYETIDILENVYINICAYIGSFISLYDISKLIDIYSSLKNIIENGTWEQGRNGKTKNIFGNMMRFSLKDNYIPILTTKK
jgi:hypothetical protein